MIGRRREVRPLDAATAAGHRGVAVQALSNGSPEGARLRILPALKSALVARPISWIPRIQTSLLWFAAARDASLDDATAQPESRRSFTAAAVILTALTLVCFQPL